MPVSCLEIIMMTESVESVVPESVVPESVESVVPHNVSPRIIRGLMIQYQGIGRLTVIWAGDL